MIYPTILFILLSQGSQALLKAVKAFHYLLCLSLILQTMVLLAIVMPFLVDQFEHKMGINANATCVINFDGAKGYLIGEVNRGLNCMFTFMNVARLGVATEGVAAAEASFQGALALRKRSTTDALFIGREES